MNRLTTAAVVAASTSALAAASAFAVLESDRLRATGAALIGAAKDAVNWTVAPPASQCQRLVGVWTTLGFELVVRPDDMAYDPGSGAIGAMTCVGQSARIRWPDGEEERFAVSANGERLTQSGAVLGVQYDRASRNIPPDRYGPPARAPSKGLDLSGL